MFSSAVLLQAIPHNLLDCIDSAAERLLGVLFSIYVSVHAYVHVCVCVIRENRGGAMGR